MEELIVCRVCGGVDVLKTEQVKSVLINKVNPISNSRVQSINDFSTTRKRNEIKTSVLTCTTCGYVSNEEEIKNNQNMAYNNSKKIDQINRLNDILKEHKANIMDGSNTISNALSDARRQLASARQQIEDARQEIANKRNSKITYSGNYDYNETLVNTSIYNRPTTKKTVKITIYDIITKMFSGSHMDIITFDDIEYYDITFHEGIDLNDDRLYIFEDGDVVEWTNKKKSGLLDLFKSSEKLIKVMRVEKSILDKWFGNKTKKDEN